MEVVSLRRLRTKKVPRPKKRSIFYLVPRMVLVGIVIAVGTIVTAIKLDMKPARPHTVDQPSKTLAAHTSQESNIPSRQFINPEQIASDRNDQAIYFANNFLASLPPPTPDCRAVACVALTFDDGPNRDSTPIILDALERNFAQATFFEIGNKVADHKDLLLRMQADGDDIGNHSWSHPSFLKLTPDQIKQQIKQTQKVIESSGVAPPHLFRPPYDDFRLGMLKDINMAVILWNVDPKDWAYNDPAQIAAIIAKQIKPGAIIVLHDKPATAKAMHKLLADLKSKYRFVTVSQLLNLHANSKGAYVGR